MKSEDDFGCTRQEFMRYIIPMIFMITHSYSDDDTLKVGGFVFSWIQARNKQSSPGSCLHFEKESIVLAKNNLGEI